MNDRITIVCVTLTRYYTALTLVFHLFIPLSNVIQSNYNACILFCIWISTRI